MLSNRAYDILSRVQRWLPSLGVFYIALAKTWGFPCGGEVNETVAAAATLIAATLEVSSAAYYRGVGGNAR